MIKVIDYGLGNVTSFINVFKSLGKDCELAKTESDLQGATHLILPGVGSFDYAMELFIKSGLKKKIESLVFEDNIPILGVCVGMQILGESSDEGKKAGLGWISGNVKKIQIKQEHQTKLSKFFLPLPHMGWNSITDVSECENSIFKNVDLNKGFYFLHSYFFETTNSCIAMSSYPEKFCCAIQSKNIFGVQFHPEKSLLNGTMLLKNFSNI